MKLFIVITVLLAAGAVHSARHQKCKCYEILRYNRFRETWDDARQECLNIGGDLVKIDNIEEDQEITSMLQTEARKRHQRGWWIGGKLVKGKWQWADGSPMDYQNFPFVAEDEPAFGAQPRAQIVNYAAIFYDQGAYNWGYVSPRDISKMGIICEINNC